MTLTLNESSSGKVLEVRIGGKLAKQDYEHFGPEVERLIGVHGKIRVLVELHDFHGWTAGALWEDIKFDMKHFSHIERIAIIGETSWQHGMAVFCKPFTSASVRYFDQAQKAEAESWIKADLPATA